MDSTAATVACLGTRRNNASTSMAGAPGPREAAVLAAATGAGEDAGAGAGADADADRGAGVARDVRPCTRSTPEKLTRLQLLSTRYSSPLRTYRHSMSSDGTAVIVSTRYQSSNARIRPMAPNA